jgi:hypothetical protein
VLVFLVVCERENMKNDKLDMLVFFILGFLMFLSIDALVESSFGDLRTEKRKTRCLMACYPEGVLFCDTGHTLCRSGKFIWRKPGQP